MFNYWKSFFFFPWENLQVVTHFGNFKFMHGFWLSKGTGRKQSLWSCTDQKEKKKKKNIFGENLQSSKTFPTLHLPKKRFTILKSKMKHMTMTQIALIFFNLLETTQQSQFLNYSSNLTLISFIKVVHNVE